MSKVNEFKKSSIEKRKEESAKILTKYPGRLPVIIASLNISFKLETYKYLVPADITLSQFMFIIRKRCNVPSEKGLFIFINNTLPIHSQMMSEIYNKNKESDGFLYMTISEENTFG